MPLFLFHLLEFIDVDYDARRGRAQRALGARRRPDGQWSPDHHQGHDRGRRAPDRRAAARASGGYHDDGDGGLRSPAATDWHRLEDEAEAFYLRIAEDGEYRYPGADLGILVARGRLQTDDYELTPRAPRLDRRASRRQSAQGPACPIRRDRDPARPTRSASSCCDVGHPGSALTARPPSGRRGDAGAVWATVSASAGPRYRPWFLRDGDARPPELRRVGRGCIETHMPELAPACRTAVRARRRGRPGGPDALDGRSRRRTSPAARRASGPGRRARAGPQLRLPGPTGSRAILSRTCLDRPPGDRDERLRCGACSTA